MPIVPRDSNKTPPRKSATVKPSQTSPARAGAVASGRQESVDGLFKMAAAACIMRGNYADAGAISMHSESISREVATLAAQNEQVAKLVDYMTSAGPYSGILIAVLPLALQLAANHDRINPDKAAGLGGVLPKDMLEKKVALDINQQRSAIEAQLKLQAANADTP